MTFNTHFGKILIRVTCIGVLFVIRPTWVIIFVCVAALLGGLIHALGSGVGLNTPEGYWLAILYGLHFFVSGLAPVVSAAWRKRVCCRQADFKDASFGLAVISVTGVPFILYGAYSLVSAWLQISFPEGFIDQFFEYLFAPIVLVAAITILVLIMRRRRRGELGQRGSTLTMDKRE